MSNSEAKTIALYILFIVKGKPPTEFGRETMIRAAEELIRLDKLEDAILALLRESPLLQGCPHEGSVTGKLVKKVLEAMNL
jgi:hypothetical protein